MMVGMKSRDIVTEEPKAEKGKTFGTVSTITTEANQDDDQVKQVAAASNRAKVDHETTTPLELGDLMAKLNQIDKKLKHSKEDREVIKKIKIQQTRVPGQLFQSGEGDRGKASADIRQGRGH